MLLLILMLSKTYFRLAIYTDITGYRHIKQKEITENLKGFLFFINHCRNKMEEILSCYNIDFKQFTYHLKKSEGVVAGGMALWGFLRQNGIDPGYTPSDIDIWFPLQNDSDESCTCMVCCNDVLKNYKGFIKFLDTQGYYRTDKFTMIDPYYDELGLINEVVSFMNSAGKEIQVIMLNLKCIHDYFIHSFDFSMCISWWDADTNIFMNVNPERTLKKEFYCVKNKNAIGNENLSTKEKKRLQKYIARGFTFVENPCPFVEAPDRLDCLNVLKDLEAFDIFTYEDVNVVDFLKASDWHMILKAGEKYYAFHRKVLYNYMEEKSVSVPFLDDMFVVYETPFNQCVTEYAWDRFVWSDYTIFELIYDYSVQYGVIHTEEKSLFTLRCYTVEQWGKTMRDSTCKAGLILPAPHQLKESSD